MSYRALEPLAEDARLVLSLIAHATKGEAAASFDRGVKELGIPLALLDARAISLVDVKAALARLNQLAPDAKAAAGEGAGTMRARRRQAHR